jgi:hypothetical protein
MICNMHAISIVHSDEDMLLLFSKDKFTMFDQFILQAHMAMHRDLLTKDHVGGYHDLSSFQFSICYFHAYK